MEFFHSKENAQDSIFLPNPFAQNSSGNCITFYHKPAHDNGEGGVLFFIDYYLDIRSMYDVQISSRYNDVYDEENLPDDNYELVTDFLSEHGIETDYDCTFSLYLPSKDDFHNRMKYDFPVVAISLSDYNTIRKMLGYEPITLSEDEFTTQWQSIATNEERDSFLKEHSSILTDAGELTLSEHSFYEEAIGETAYNSYTDVLYVFPDSICENLLPVIRNRYIMTTESISYENARALEQAFSAEYPEITDTGVSYAIRLSTLQVNTTKASNFVLQASMLYAAVVLMVICLTVLSLQQLLDASQYKYRFSVLHKLGVEDTHIGTPATALCSRRMATIYISTTSLWPRLSLLCRRWSRAF